MLTSSPAPSAPGPGPTIAATVHDPGGAFLPGLARCRRALEQAFGAVCVLATDSTSDAVVAFLETELRATVIRAAANGEVGRHRRLAVDLARRTRVEAVVYSDLDHVLRWIEAAPRELASIVSDRSHDLTVVGRTPAAMAACPTRLRETESVVNRIFALATGHAWDVMFAIRMLSPAAAAVIVDEATEDGYANDVEWPMLVERAGLDVGYREADGLSYRIAQDFDAADDLHDGDPVRWIERVAIAHGHAQAIRRMLPAESR